MHVRGTIMTAEEAEDVPHVHAWQPVGITKSERIYYSPVSKFDHTAVVYDIAVQSCACGAFHKEVVGKTERWLNR